MMKSLMGFCCMGAVLLLVVLPAIMAQTTYKIAANNFNYRGGSIGQSICGVWVQDLAAKCDATPNCVGFTFNRDYEQGDFTYGCGTLKAIFTGGQPERDTVVYQKPLVDTSVQAPALTLVKRFVFRNQQSRRCLGQDDRQRIYVFGMALNRAVQKPCAARDESQGFTVKQVNRDTYQILGFRGRCLTTYNGIFESTAVFMECDNRVDKRWKIDSLSPRGKGPYLLQSKENGKCLVNSGGGRLVLAPCNTGNAGVIWESQYVNVAGK